eukprot:3001244-Prymnesium_polylepis.1
MTLGRQGLLTMLQPCCALLEVLIMGWQSEFEDLGDGGPEADVEFSSPMWCQPRLLTEGALPNLRVLAMPGYVYMMPQNLLNLGTPPIVTLDLCNLQMITDQDFRAALSRVAPTLAHLN